MVLLGWIPGMDTTLWSLLFQKASADVSLLIPIKAGNSVGVQQALILTLSTP